MEMVVNSYFSHYRCLVRQGSETGMGEVSAEKIRSLSERQKEVLRLIARHQRDKEIARILKISEHTARAHADAARRKLAVSTRRDAALLLVQFEATESIPADREYQPAGIASAKSNWAHSPHEHSNAEGRQTDNELEGTEGGLGHPRRPGISGSPARTFDDDASTIKDLGPASDDNGIDGADLLPVGGVISADRRLHIDGVEGSGSSLENSGASDKAIGGRGHSEHGAGDGAAVRSRTRGANISFSNSLADVERWGRFKVWLKTLGPLQWTGMILIIALCAAFIFAGFLLLSMGLLGVMEQIFRRAS